MSALEFAISNPAPNLWKLSRWMPRRWFNPSHWEVIATATNEADIKDALRRHSTPHRPPHRPTTKYYDKHGDEDVGGGW